MVLIERKLRDIPRKEIDALDALLGKILTKTGGVGFAGREWVDIEGRRPFANLSLTYDQGEIKEAARVEAEGPTKEGNFEVSLKLNLPDETYVLMMKNLEKQAPILTRSLPKLPSYSSS